MTDPILPDDLANGLVDGTVDIASLPAELRGVAEVFAAAHRPAAGAELAGMAAAVQQFSTVVTSTSPAAAIAVATSTGVISMFGARLTKRAAVIVGATVLFAGTAAAAAGGVLPTPFSDSVRDFTPPALARAATTSTDGSQTTESTENAEAPSSSDDDAVAAAAGAVEDATITSYPGRDFGRCTAWTNGAPKNTAAPAFADLLEQAKKAGMDVDAYCAAVLAAHVDDDTSTSNSTETSSSNSVDDKGGQNNGGQNNGGQNNGGHGADDPATSVSTPASVSNPSNSAPGQSAPGTSVDSGSGQNGKGKGGGGNDSATSSSNP